MLTEIIIANSNYNNMKNSKSKKFKWRAFVSLYISFSFIIIVISGIVLYLAPSGRIAHWTQIYILGLEKDSWQAIHTIFTYLFVIGGGLHIYYNWKPLMSYFKNKAKEKISIRKELLFSLILTIAIFAFTLKEIPPFSSVMELGETLKDSWSNEQTEPPVPHAESMSFVELAEVIELSAAGMINNLSKSGIIALENEIIENVAVQNNITPMELFEKMKAVLESSSVSKYANTGIGRKSLEEVCKMLNLDLTETMVYLKKSGYTVNKGETIKKIADNNSLEPRQVMEILENNN